jgi:hypothetical protein
MAANDGERRMLFDIRGRRKNVVRVVYAVLALLMGLSLFFVIGPAPISELFGGNSADGGNNAEPFEEQAARIEGRLKKEPEDPQLLLNLSRARTNVGNQLSVVNPETGESQMTAAARQQFEKAGIAWEDYVKATDEPSPSGAVLAAGNYFRLAQTSRTPAEIEANLDAAAAAQQLVVDKRPSGGALATLALYRFFSFEYDEARKLIDEATKVATTKFERENLDDEAEEVELRARELQRQFKESKEVSKGRGKESLENPLGGLGGGTTLTE